MTSPMIRPTQMSDIPPLQTVLDQTGLFPSALLPEMLEQALAKGAARAPETGLWLTCELDGQPVGFCHARPEEMTDRCWNLLALAVLPECQGRGLGAALVQAAERVLRQGGQRLLIVDTSGTAGFARTRGFYARLGYEQAATIRDFWADGDDKVTFHKAL